MKDLSLSKKNNMDINIFKNLNKKNINIKYDHNIYEHALKIYNNFNFQIIYYKINEYNKIKRQSQGKINGYDKKVYYEVSMKNVPF